MVPPGSDRISRGRSYSGTNLAFTHFFAYGAITLCRSSFQKLLLKCAKGFIDWPYSPKNKFLVWAIPTSLAATMGISYRFLFLCLLRCVTSAGLASVAYVFSYRWWRITSTGFPHSDISGSTPFPALRSFSQVSRPSSPIDTKASTNSP